MEKESYQYNDLKSYFENYEELNVDYHIISDIKALMRGLLKIGETDGIRVEQINGKGISFEKEYEIWKMKEKKITFLL